MTATIHHLPSPEATTAPDPGAIFAAAKYLTACGLPPSAAARICRPGSLAAARLKLAMVQAESERLILKAARS